MNCPHCQRELPKLYDSYGCPFCGKDLPTSESDSLTPRPRTAKTYWLVFFAVLLAPAIITMISAMLDRSLNQNVSFATGLFGGAAAGIACGIMLGLRLGSTGLEKIIVTFLLCGIMAVVAVTLSCVGCQAGGYNLSLH